MNASPVVVHSIPGRVRLTLGDRRGDSAYFARLANVLGAQPGVLRVKDNARAASIVIEYQGQFDTVAAALQASGLAVPPGEAHARAARPPPPAPAYVPALKLVSGRDLSPTFMAGLVFLGVGVVQLLRGQIMVPASTALWYAISVLPHAGWPAAVPPAAAGIE